MALVAVPMDFGDGLRCTSTAGGASYAFLAAIGADPRFAGPQFSFAFRFLLSGPAFAFDLSALVIRFGDLNGSLTRFGIEVRNRDVGLWDIAAVFNSTACPGASEVLYTVARDLLEHSVVWTYDQAGNQELWFDGVLVDTRAATCADVSSPSAADDTFNIIGNPDVGPLLFDVDQVHFTNAVMTPAQVATFHSTGTF